jgi:AcrR family transcriptional regulator
MQRFLREPPGVVLSPDAPQAVDHRKAPRRRGEVLQRAILAAALEELAEVGYSGLTMDRVAARARTSKSALYRRWPGRAELVVDACKQYAITSDDVPDTGDLRSDMITFLRLLSARMGSPVGGMLRVLLGEMTRAPELAGAVRERIFNIGPTAVVTILRRAVARGEVPPEVAGSRRATVATDLLRNEFLLYGAPVPDETIVEIVDEVYLPLILRPRRSTAGRPEGKASTSPPDGRPPGQES